MATNQSCMPQFIGWYSRLATGSLGQALSVSGSKFAFGFVPESNKTISEISTYFQAVTGSGNVTCDIYSDSSGQPNASLGTVSITQGAGWNRFSGGTLGVAVTKATQYWAVISPTSVSVYPTVSFWSGIPNVPVKVGASGRYGFASWYYNGTSWGSNRTTLTGLRIGYTDGTYDGLPSQSGFFSFSTHVDGSNELGFQFQWPTNATGNIIGAIIGRTGSTGSPTGNNYAKLYTAAGSVDTNTPTLLASSAKVPAANLVAGDYSFQFDTDQKLVPGQYCIVTLADDVVESAGNYCTLFGMPWDSDSNSLALLPLKGTFRAVALTSGTWSLLNAVTAGGVWLDTTGPFASSGGNNPRGIMTGGRL